MLFHRRIACLLLTVFGGPVWAFQDQSEYSSPPPLTFSEIRALARPEPPPEAVLRKLQRLLNTPFIENRATSDASTTSAASGLRVGFWNIERGLEWESIAAAFKDGDAYRARNPSNSYTSASGIVLKQNWRSSGVPTSSS